VHLGFRNSLNSIARRLKELTLAAIAPGDDFSDYDLILTGHSLGGALSTLFATDIAEYGFDAGRSLPQTAPSEPWWETLTQSFITQTRKGKSQGKPPKPKSLKVYNFGSPRVGNAQFVAKFDSLLGKGIDEAYRIVNGADAVARMPRSFNVLIAEVDYDHCGPTVLLSSLIDAESANTPSDSFLWVEGESDDTQCPVRDGIMLAAAKIEETQPDNDIPFDAKNMLAQLKENISDKAQKFSLTDLTSAVGINKDFVERETKVMQSLLSGDALAHHMEDKYYEAIGASCGFVSSVGEDIKLREADV